MTKMCKSCPSPSSHLSAKIHQENQRKFNYRKPVDEGIWNWQAVEMFYYGTWMLPINPSKQKKTKIFCCPSYMHISSSLLLQRDRKTMTILKIKESEPTTWSKRTMMLALVFMTKDIFRKVHAIWSDARDLLPKWKHPEKSSITPHCVQLNWLGNDPRAWKGVGWRKIWRWGWQQKRGTYNERK